jgi:non-ribosomal peptide synthetase component F
VPGITPRFLTDGHNGTAKFDLTLGLTEMPEGLVGILEYNTDLFDTATAERMAGHFRRLLDEVIRDPGRPLSDLPLLSDNELTHLQTVGEGVKVDRPADRCVHYLFEVWAAARPGATAVVFDEQRITYDEFNRRANRLAHYLRGRGVGPEVLVGLCLERSVETVLGVVAVLKAGGAFVPLDPALPRERLGVMLDDCRPRLVLTQRHLARDLPFDPGSVVVLDAGAPPWDGSSDANPESGVAPSNLAYVIYTSGSTGTPKGVMVEHRGVVNAFDGWDDAYNLRELSAFMAMANFAFDVFTGDWLRALGTGGKLVLCPTETLLDPPRLLDLIRREQTDYVECVPAILRPTLRYLEETGQLLDPARVFVCGAEVWYGSEFKRL